MAQGNRAKVLACLNRFDAALAAFDQARQLQGDRPTFDTRSNRAATLLACGRRDEGRAALEEAARMLTSDPPARSSERTSIVRNLFLRTKDPAEWRRLIPDFVEVFAHRQVVAALGQGLVASIRTLRCIKASPDVSSEWVRVWRELAGGHKEMALPLRLLGAAVHYLASGDDRPLLALPVEERRIVEPLLGLEPDGGSGPEFKIA
ncbi:MAG: hypothetical protein HZA54_07370 [Planctomycetes bacterium]|nr:hypothetical protein [Planctomycetota bacterium]